MHSPGSHADSCICLYSLLNWCSALSSILYPNILHTPRTMWPLQCILNTFSTHDAHTWKSCGGGHPASACPCLPRKHQKNVNWQPQNFMKPSPNNFDSHYPPIRIDCCSCPIWITCFYHSQLILTCRYHIYYKDSGL